MLEAGEALLMVGFFDDPIAYRSIFSIRRRR